MSFELNEKEIVIRHFFVNYPKTVRTYKFHNTQREEIVRQRYNECTLALYYDKDTDVTFIGWSKLGKKEKQFNRKMGKKIAIGRLKNAYNIATTDSLDALADMKYALPNEIGNIMFCFLEDFLENKGIKEPESDLKSEQRKILKENTGN